jgi:hypothetical protein
MLTTVVAATKIGCGNVTFKNGEADEKNPTNTCVGPAP